MLEDTNLGKKVSKMTKKRWMSQFRGQIYGFLVRYKIQTWNSHHKFWLKHTTIAQIINLKLQKKS